MNVETVLSEIPVLHTSRLTLRPLHARDAQAVFELYSSPAIMAWNVYPPFRRLYEAEDLLKYHAALFESQRGVRWAITLAKESHLIGTCGYHNWQRQIQEAELSYELSPHFWRRGLMSETLAPVLDYGIREMKLTRIRAKIMKKNIASIALLEKFGFQPVSSHHTKEPKIQNGREMCWYELLRQNEWDRG